ncbi:unnamed protein product [Prunus armeniaca]
MGSRKGKAHKMRSRNMGFLWTSCGQPIPRRRNPFQLQPKRKTDKRALLPYAWLVNVLVPVPIPEVSKLAWDHAPHSE